MPKKKNQLVYVKTCITLPKHLWHSLRNYAFNRQMSQSEVVTNILTLGLGLEQKKKGGQ